MGKKKVFHFTEEGLKELKKKLEFYKGEKRKKVAERIKEAISFGDLSENDEYKEAKEEQGFIEGFIVDTEYKINNAEIISKDKSDKVQIGSKIVIRCLDDKDGKDEEFFIVGVTEADIIKKKISIEAPISKSAIGKEEGDKIVVDAPAGKINYKIIKIS